MWLDTNVVRLGGGGGTCDCFVMASTRITHTQFVTPFMFFHGKNFQSFPTQNEDPLDVTCTHGCSSVF